MELSGETSVVRNAEPGGASVNGASSSETLRQSAWFRYGLPSGGDLIFVLLLISLTVGPLAQRLLGDAGIGWHIRTGELILQARSIPRVDSFSSIMGGQSWYAWEWLYDASVAAIHHASGLNGVVFFSALVIALTFTLVFRMMLARGAGLPIAVLMLLLAVSASTIHFFARPHVVSWLFTVIWFGVLEAFEADGKPRRLLWLPVMMLVWVNLHGGFVVGLVLLCAHLVSAWSQGLRFGETPDGQGARVRTRTLGITGILCFVATFANPYGYQLHVHIYLYLTDPFLMDHIDEFLSPNFHGIAQKCFTVLLLLTVLGVALGRKKLGISQLLVACFAIYTGLYSSRNIPVSSMLLVLVMAPIISAAVAEWAATHATLPIFQIELAPLQAFAGRMGAMESRMRGHLWPILIVLSGIWLCGHQGRIVSRTVIDSHFDENRFPVHAVDFLAGSDIHEPVFCPDSWGGYLIYRLYPQMQVVVDDRHDLYGADFLKEYLKLVKVEHGWDVALLDLHANQVLVPKSSALASLLEQVPEWTIGYQDDTATLFSRVSKRSGRE